MEKTYTLSEIETRILDQLHKLRGDQLADLFALLFTCKSATFEETGLITVEEEDGDGVVMPANETTNEIKYTLCRHCDHFVDPCVVVGLVHLEDGEQEFDHVAELSDETRLKSEWIQLRPDLFQKYEDGKSGPNSQYHSRRGKVN